MPPPRGAGSLNAIYSKVERLQMCIYLAAVPRPPTPVTLPRENVAPENGKPAG